MNGEKLTICLKAKVGSRAYNFATETSDHDIRGFGLQKSLSRIIGLREPLTEESKDPDFMVWDILAFTKLALRNNTNCCDVLHAEPFNVLECNRVGELYQLH